MKHPASMKKDMAVLREYWEEYSPYLVRFQSLIALMLMVVVLSLSSKSFLTVGNILTVMQQISVNVCLSVGMTLVILTGGIDLSVGSILALSGAVAAGLLRNGLELPAFNLFIRFTILGAVLGGVVVGGLLGCFNGIAITKFKVPPFVATLAMMAMARGLTQRWTGGHAITSLGPALKFIGGGRFLRVPMPVWIAGIIVAAAAVVAKKTRFGRHVYAVGGNEKAALLSGLNVTRIKIAVYTLTGALAAIGGLIVTARLNSAQPRAGLGYELDSIAAVVIGGTSLSGGKGSVLGTVLGALIIGVLNNGMVLLGIPAFWQLFIKGLVILLAVVIDKLNLKD